MNLRTLGALVVALGLAFPSLAATFAERSPFTQGHWWNPARAGSGFELFNVGNEAMAIWYTFEESGQPVWYTAQGPIDGIWPLLKHRWENGRHAGYSDVGTLRLTFRAPESADLAFNIGGRTGTQRIEPFVVSVTPNEVDHTGSYFDPTNSGWGFTLTQQGDVLGGVLYTYEPNGTPTWYAGFDRGSPGSVAVIRAAGACPHCSWRPNATTNAGRLAFDFTSERDFVMRSELTFPMAAGVNLDARRVAQLGRPASTRPADRQLVAFGTDALALTYLRQGLLSIYAFPSTSGIDFSPAPSGTGGYSFSTTNLQEAGVDEADLVKTDGRYIYTFAHDNFGTRLPAVRVAEVASQGASMEPRGAFPLGFSNAQGTQVQSLSVAGMYLAGNRLATITGTSPLIANGFSGWGPSAGWTQGTTHVEVFDITNRTSPTSVWRVHLDGHLVTSRRIGERLYVVSRFIPYVPGLLYGATSGASLEANIARLSITPLSALLPQIRSRSDFGGPAEPLLGAQTLYALPQGGRPATSDMFLVTTIDLAQPRIVQSVGLVGAVDTVYASTNSIYLAAARVPIRVPNGLLLPASQLPQAISTQVHQLNLVAGGVEVIGSGSAEGFLGASLNDAPFRMSEHRGRMRLVTGLTSGGENRNLVTILEPSTVAPGLLKTVAVLPNAQRPQRLGLPLETLRSTRFIGDRLYAVTFGPAFQGAPPVDPLYVVDLANASDPRITGELVVPGFSRYLHPLPGDRLLGLGYDVDTRNIITGLQVSLYDVSDDGRPRELQKLVFGSTQSDSAALYDHHAFSALLDASGRGTFAIPARITSAALGTAQNPFPWVESGLMRFSLTGTGAATTLTQLPSLITARPPSGTNAFQDPAAIAGSARSVLFPNGTVYLTRGFFSHQDNAGNARVGF